LYSSLCFWLSYRCPSPIPSCPSSGIVHHTSDPLLHSLLALQSSLPLLYCCTPIQVHKAKSLFLLLIILLHIFIPLPCLFSFALASFSHSVLLLGHFSNASGHFHPYVVCITSMSRALINYTTNLQLSPIYLFLEHSRELRIISLIKGKRYKGTKQWSQMSTRSPMENREPPTTEGKDLSSSSPSSSGIMARPLVPAIFQAMICSPSLTSVVAVRGVDPLNTQSLWCLHSVQAPTMMRELRPFLLEVLAIERTHVHHS
jgi:hypothetical protein